jgi:tetratricopeptide (TPR) repeat protein
MKRIYGGLSVTFGILSIFVQSNVTAALDGKTVSNFSVNLEYKHDNLSNHFVSVVQARLLADNIQQAEFNYQDYDFWSNQCTVLENAQKFSEALAACEKAIALKPKRQNTDLWESRSNILLQLGKYAEAVASNNQILKKQPKNSFALTQRCEALYALGNYEEAISSCESALLVNGNWRNITPALTWYNRSLALRKVKRLESALTSLERAVNANPNYSLALAEQCGVLIDLQRNEQALIACDLALQTNGDWGKAKSAIAWNNKALALTKLGKIQEAIAAYEQALLVSPSDVVSLVNQGVLLQTVGQYEKALISFNRTTELNPTYSKALMHRCETLNRLQQFSEALASCDRALKNDDTWGDTPVAILWNHRSSALLGLQKYSEALFGAERALSLKEDYAEAWNNKGVSLWNLGNYKEAIAATKRATEINPRYVQGWFNYGRVLSSVKEYRNAVTAYSQALKGNLTEVDSSTLASIWANQGVALWHLHSFNLALASTNEAIKINPKSFEGWYNKGIVLLELGKYNQALQAYRKAEQLSPQNPYVWTGIGMALAGQGEYKEALKAFDEALNINPGYTVAQQQRQKILSQL